MTRFILAAVFVSVLGCGGAKTTEVIDPAPTEEVKPPEVGELAAVDGKALYEQVCITCHGPTGDGRGLEQQLFSFGSPDDQWKNGANEDGIIITLLQGTHDSSMQPFPQYGEADRRAVARYVLELRAAFEAETP